MSTGNESDFPPLSDRYRIERELGAGGMAIVYLATDLRHGRKVAIKVLRPELGAVLGAQRFLSEIQVTASLQHPHLLPLFDSGEANGLLFYVMPYIEGESLRERLDRDRHLTVDEALRIAGAVASALDYAHQRGVVHRDLKPENILLQAGQPVVVDFGIALAVSAAGGRRLTQTGLSLGTPQYMSPEQAARDDGIDARSDIYSLGAVTYELLAGEPPHSGKSVQAVIARVLTERPRSVRLSRPSVPDHVDNAIARALDKVPADRFESAGAFAHALLDPEPHADAVARDARQETSSAAPEALKNARWYSWAAALVLMTVAAIAAALWMPRQTPVSPRPLIATLLAGPGHSFLTGAGFQLSPDGSALVYVAELAPGRRQLVIQSLHVPHESPLPGTEDAWNPFWSPDGRAVAFWANGWLKAIEVNGTGLRSLCRSKGTFGAGAWGSNGVVLFEHEGGLHRTDPPGTRCEPVIAHDTAWLAAARVTWLPDGRHFLFNGAESARLYIGDVQTGRHTLLSPEREQAVCAPPRYIVFHHADGGIYAQDFDPARRRLQGTPWRVFERDAFTWGRGMYSVSANGVLVAEMRREDRQSVLAWTRNASIVDSVTVPDLAFGIGTLRLTRDGRRASFDGNVLRMYDIERKLWDPPLSFTSDPRQVTIEHAWSPRDSHVAISLSNEQYTIVVVDRRTGTGRLLFPLRRALPELRPLDWSSDGRRLLYYTTDVRLWVYTFADSAAANGPARDLNIASDDARFSPDGRWIAYEARERQDMLDVYVQPFPGPGTAVRASTNGGVAPRWQPDGRGLYYVSPDGQLLHVDLALANSSPRFGTPRVVLTPPPGRRITSHEPFPDGRGHALLLAAASPPVLWIVTDWITFSRQQGGAGR